MKIVTYDLEVELVKDRKDTTNNPLNLVQKIHKGVTLKAIDYYLEYYREHFDIVIKKVTPNIKEV